MRTHNYSNKALKPHHKPNNRPQRIITGAILAFVLLLPTCQPAKAEFLDIVGADFSDILGGVFGVHKKGHENLSEPATKLQKTTGLKLTNGNRQNLTKPHFQIIFGVHKKEFLESIKKEFSDTLEGGYLRYKKGVLRTVRTHGGNLWNSTHTREASHVKLSSNAFNQLSHDYRDTACQPAIASDDASRYDERLSKLTSGQPYRYSLAFFVPDVCPASQVGHAKDTSTYPKIIGVNRHIMPTLATNYDGVTSQNTKANRRICGAVSSKTESEPRHLLNLSKLDIQSVASTQNLLGGNHA